MSTYTTSLIFYLLLASSQLTNAHLIKRKGAGGGGGGARGGSFSAGGGGGGGGSSGGSESLTHDQWKLIFIIVGTLCGVLVAAIVGVKVYWRVRTRRRTAAIHQHFEKHARYSYIGDDSSITKLKATAAIGVRKPERTYLRY